MTYMSWSRDFALYLLQYLMEIHHIGHLSKQRARQLEVAYQSVTHESLGFLKDSTIFGDIAIPIGGAMELVGQFTLLRLL